MSSTGKMILGSLVTDLCDEIGLMAPENLFDAEDDFARQLLAILHKLGRELCANYGWPQLKKMVTAAGDAVEDFDRFVNRSKKEYYSTFWVEGADGLRKEKASRLDDRFLFSDSVMQNGLKYMLLETKGLESSNAFAQFQQAVHNGLSQANYAHQKNLDLGFLDGSKPSGVSLHPFGL